MLLAVPDAQSAPAVPSSSIWLAQGMAGVALGHCLENTSEENARYLVIGTRAPREDVVYPDNDRRLAFDRQTKTRNWTDHAGQPASNPYKLA